MGPGRYICGCERRITHTNAYSDGYSYSYSYSYRYSYSHSYSHSYCHGDADTYPNADRDG